MCGDESNPAPYHFRAFPRHARTLPVKTFRKSTGNGRRIKTARSQRFNSRRVQPGLCLIIVNFTDALAGYKCDVRRITNYFHSLGYDVIGGVDGNGDEDGDWRDLTPTLMRERLSQLAQRTQTGNTRYQRLFVFVITAQGRLTHCDVTSDATPRENDVSAGELVTLLTNVKSMRTVPKLFFVHNCTSAYDTRVNRTGDSGATWQHDNDFDVTANNMIFYKSLDLSHRSIMVPGEGTWLVENIVQAFEDFGMEYSVRDILALVNRHIWKIFSEEGRPYRLPSWTSTISSKFHLHECSEQTI